MSLTSNGQINNSGLIEVINKSIESEILIDQGAINNTTSGILIIGK